MLTAGNTSIYINIYAFPIMTRMGKVPNLEIKKLLAGTVILSTVFSQTVSVDVCMFTFSLIRQ